MKDTDEEYIYEQFFEELAKRYPLLMEKSIIDYIGVDVGWHQIIDDLCRTIYTEYESATHSHYAATRYPRDDGGRYLADCQEKLQKAIDNLPVIAQVKEKMGTMRFYVQGHDRRVDALVSMAELISTHTCEVCGKPGKLDTNSGWFKTHCPEHFNPDEHGWKPIDGKTSVSIDETDSH